MSYIQSKNISAVQGILPIAHGGTGNSTGNGAEYRFIDFINGNDTTGTGSLFAPWKTLQHAYNSVSPTINVPYIFYLSGGNNDTDAGTITGKPNVTLFAESPIQVSAPLTISGGTSNDGISFINIIFTGAVTWIRNDVSVMGVFMNGCEFFSGPVLKQNGAGNISITAQNCLTVNLDVKTGPTGSFFTSHNFLGSSTFEDATSAAYYQFLGGYTDSGMVFNGAPTVYFSGMQADTPFGYSITCNTTANGSPTLQFDSGSVPPTITGTFTQTLISHAQWEAYSPTTSANWNSVPGTVLAGLDDLAGSGIVKSQSAKQFLASPNGTSGVPSFRSIVSSDLPTVAIAQGGTGQTTANAAFNALSPMTTKGDIIYEDATPVAVRLGIGSTGNVLTVSAGGIPSWAASTSGITQLTSDVTAGPGSGSQAATVAAIQGTTVSGTTGTTNVVFSTAPTIAQPTLTKASDVVQCLIKGNGTQTSDILSVTKSDNTQLLEVTNTNGTKIRGTTSNTSAAAGFVGEVLDSGQLGGSTNVGSSWATFGNLSITAGNWLVHATIIYNGSGSNIYYVGNVSTTSADSGATYGVNQGTGTVSGVGIGSTIHLVLPISISSTTTYYLNALTQTANAGTGGILGSIRALRIT